MPCPVVSVINFSRALEWVEVHEALRALNRQVTDDFAPLWGSARAILPQPVSFDPDDPESLVEEPVAGAGIVYLLDEAGLHSVLGFHDLNARHLPVGFVFVLDREDWTAALSHEILDLMIDPWARSFVLGPHPRRPGRSVLHAYDVCDPVERTCYWIDGVEVSNFVTPSYYNPSDGPRSRGDFLGIVDPFGMTRGSRVSIYDPASASFETIAGSEGPRTAVAQMIASRHRREALKRPSDETLQAGLEQYRSNLPALLHPGLPQLEGISRTARYRQAAGGTAIPAPGRRAPNVVPFTGRKPTGKRRRAPRDSA